MMAELYSPLSLIPIKVVYWLLGILLTSLTALVLWLLKKTVKGLLDYMAVAAAKLAVIENATRVTAENHLQAIQTEAEKQTIVLEALVVKQAEANGYLQAVVNMSSRRREEYSSDSEHRRV